MLETLVNRLPKGRDRGIALTVGGMAALLAGSKGLAATMFAGGLSDLEQAWRAAHPTTEATNAGAQYVIPGAEKVQRPNATQTELLF